MLRSFARWRAGTRVGTGAVVKGLAWLFCVILIVGGWLAVIQQIRFEHERATAEAVAQNENRVIAFEQYVRRTLEVASVVTQYIADRFQRGEAGPEFVGTRERPAVFLGNLARTSTFLGIAIVNADGDVVATSRPGGRSLNIAGQEAFRVHIARDSGSLFVGRPIFAPSLGRNIILLTRRLNRSDGAFAGVVSLIIPPEQFTAFYRDARVGPNDVVALVGYDGIVRSRQTGDRTTSGDDLRGTQAFFDALRYRNGTNLGIGVVDGISRYYSRRQLPGYPLYAGYAVPEAEVLAPIRYRARILVAAMAVSTMAVLAFVVVLTLLVNRNERRAREIANENSRLEDAQRLAKIGDWNLDLRNGKTGWSPGMYELFERDPALGPPTIKEYRSWLNDENIRIIDEAFEIVMGKGLSHDFEVGLALPTVGEVYHHIVAIPLLGREGEVIGVRGTAQDISGRKLIERLEARVAQLSRIDAMNAMATTLAHELNQPLAAAVNYLAGSRRHLESNLGSEAGLREGMHAAEQQILFAGNIIRRVREMVANQPRTPTTFSLASVVDDALALIATAQDGPQPKVAQKFAADARWVSADRVQVQQVLVNLLRNALEATETGGEIIVSSRRIEPGLIQVTVADTGHGFRQSEADRFSPFATKEGGLGLGLSLSRTFIESHGGRIWTEDPDGGGAAVHFTLPAAEREAEAEAST